MKKPRLETTTMLAVLALATGCAADAGKTEPGANEDALRTSGGTRQAGVLGKYQGPRVEIKTEDGHRITGTIFLEVIKRTEQNSDGYSCDNPYLINFSVRLDSGEEGWAYRTHFAEQRANGLKVFYSSSLDCGESPIYLDSTAADAFKMRLEQAYQQGDVHDYDVRTKFGYVVGSLGALEGGVFKPVP